VAFRKPYRGGRNARPGLPLVIHSREAGLPNMAAILEEETGKGGLPRLVLQLLQRVDADFGAGGPIAPRTLQSRSTGISDLQKSPTNWRRHRDPAACRAGPASWSRPMRAVFWRPGPPHRGKAQ